MFCIFTLAAAFLDAALGDSSAQHDVNMKSSVPAVSHFISLHHLYSSLLNCLKVARGTGIGSILKSFFILHRKNLWGWGLCSSLLGLFQIPSHFFSLVCLWPIINVNSRWITVIYPSWRYIESTDPDPALASFLPNYGCLHFGGKSRLVLLDHLSLGTCSDLVVTCTVPVMVVLEIRAKDMS